MSRAPRPIGVLGGMGPAATLDFLAKVQARVPPGARDQDHLRLLVDINPQVPDRNAALRGEGPSPAQALVAMAQGLERAGAEALVMVCNSAHAFAADIRCAVQVPLLSIVEETVATIRREHPQVRAAGLLAADAALEARLYQYTLTAVGVSPVTLDAQDQARLMEVIYHVKAGVAGSQDRATVERLAGRLREKGAEIIVVACTEVPLVLDAASFGFPVLDSTEVLVSAVIRFASSDPGAV